MTKRNRTQTSFYIPDDFRRVRPATECDGWSPNEQALFDNDNKAYQKEQERRRLAGQTPIIICMGGPYSDAWYPPLH
tara:strand:- start:460 stop:690 length:231 start_codon:yes stop_codon:yes gene_type:complete